MNKHKDSILIKTEYNKEFPLKDYRDLTISLSPIGQNRLHTMSAINSCYYYSSKLKKNNSRVSLFVEANKSDIKTAKLLNADCVEIHTGKLCELVNENKNYNHELKRIKNAANLGNELGLEVHAGHGLTYHSAKILTKVKGVKEYNIGHFLIGESIFVGLKKSIREFKKIIR